MEKPLEGIRAIDWTLFQHGTFGTAMLANVCAQVVLQPPDRTIEPFISKGLRRQLASIGGRPGVIHI